jgi:tetratricopeptide (TPR) repeat protein
MKTIAQRLRTSLPALLALALCACASTPEPQLPTTRSGSSRDIFAAQAQATPGTTEPVLSADDGLARGDEAWRHGNLDLAIYLFVQGLRFNPKDTRLLSKIGSIHEGRGKASLARRAFEMAHDAEPDDVRITERLGLLQLADGDLDEARETLKAANAARPDRWQVLDGLGQLAQKSGKLEEALEHYDRAFWLNPQSAQILIHRGDARLLAGRPVSAENDFRAAIALEDSPEAWKKLGDVQASQRDYGAAFESYLRKGTVAQAHNQVGEAAMLNADHAMARSHFERAAQASPTYYELAHKNLALANEKLEQKER